MGQIGTIHAHRASRRLETLVYNTIQFMFQEKEGGQGVKEKTEIIRVYDSYVAWRVVDCQIRLKRKATGKT